MLRTLAVLLALFFATPAFGQGVTIPDQKTIDDTAAQYEALESFFWRGMTYDAVLQVGTRLECLKKNPKDAYCSIDDHEHDLVVIKRGLAVVELARETYEKASNGGKDKAGGEVAALFRISYERMLARAAQKKIEAQLKKE